METQLAVAVFRCASCRFSSDTYVIGRGKEGEKEQMKKKKKKDKNKTKNIKEKNTGHVVRISIS